MAVMKITTFQGEVKHLAVRGGNQLMYEDIKVAAYILMKNKKVDSINELCAMIAESYPVTQTNCYRILTRIYELKKEILRNLQIKQKF